MSWVAIGNDEVTGTEGGIIVADEEDPLGCARITLEKDAAIAPFAITCGLYEWMVHTRFFSSADVARAQYEAMKLDLTRLVAFVPMTADPEVAAKTDLLVGEIERFVDKYPT